MTYNVGEKVTIREWNDMAAEFGLDEDGDINTPRAAFLYDMKEFCGKEFTVGNIFNHCYILNEVDGDWYFVDEMIAHGRR